VKKKSIFFFGVTLCRISINKHTHTIALYTALRSTSGEERFLHQSEFFAVRTLPIGGVPTKGEREKKRKKKKEIIRTYMHPIYLLIQNCELF